MLCPDYNNHEIKHIFVEDSKLLVFQGWSKQLSCLVDRLIDQLWLEKVHETDLFIDDLDELLSEPVQEHTVQQNSALTNPLNDLAVSAKTVLVEHGLAGQVLEVDVSLKGSGNDVIHEHDRGQEGTDERVQSCVREKNVDLRELTELVGHRRAVQP